MKTFIAVALVSSIAVAGCTTRVIERPVPSASAPSVVTTPAISERVVERGAAPAAGASAAPAACTWASQSYSSGAMSCQDHTQYRCTNGAWERTAVSC